MRVLVLGAAALMTGCGTVSSLADYPHPHLIYGGVKGDLFMLGEPVWAPLFIVDLPMSAIADTLTLPLTVPTVCLTYP